MQRVVLKTAPTSEPITLSQLKMHLRTESASFADNFDETQSIAPGVHVVADNYTTHVGTGVSVLGYSAIVSFQSGTNLAGGTVDVKIQESDDNAAWTDWTGGAFTQVTTDGAGATEPDNATYEKAYTGTKAYIRTVAKVLVANCEFGTTIIRSVSSLAEDDLLDALITTARETVEAWTRRALFTQTWYLYLDSFPGKDYIEIPFGNLQSVTSIKYKDTDGTETTMTVTTDYLVETNGDQHGRIVLPYGVSWPSVTLYPSNPITIEFVCGWTTTALIPKSITTAMKFLIAKWYESRGEDIVGNVTMFEDKTAERLLNTWRLWGEW
jgi:uncharacterized phiE125 gp8 family phage protein